MGRHAPLERIFLAGCFATIALVAAFAVFSALVRVDSRRLEPEPDVPEPARHDPKPAPPAPNPPDPGVPYRVTGRLLDLPGFPIDPGILRHTRVSLHDGRHEFGSARATPDGAFALETKAPPRGVRLRVTTRLNLTPFDRSLDREIWSERAIAPADSHAGDIPLPRSDDFGSVRGTVVDSSGEPLAPDSIRLESACGTSPPISLARLGAQLDDAANAPTEYRRGPAFTLLHVPPGAYRLSAEVLGRLIPPVEVTVGTGETRVTVAERNSLRRFQGTVRDALGRRPLGAVEVTIASAAYAGPATRDPIRVAGRSSGAGAFDLPVPDVLPAGGLRISFVRHGFRGTDLLVTEGDFRDNLAIRNLELARD